MIKYFLIMVSGKVYSDEIFLKNIPDINIFLLDRSYNNYNHK